MKTKTPFVERFPDRNYKIRKTHQEQPIKTRKHVEKRGWNQIRERKKKKTNDKLKEELTRDLTEWWREKGQSKSQFLVESLVKLTYKRSKPSFFTARERDSFLAAPPNPPSTPVASLWVFLSSPESGLVCSFEAFPSGILKFVSNFSFSETWCVGESATIRPSVDLPAVVVHVAATFAVDRIKRTWIFFFFFL